VDCLEHQTVHTNQSSPWRTNFPAEYSKTLQDIRMYKGPYYVPMVCKLTTLILLLPRFRRNNTTEELIQESRTTNLYMHFT